MNSLHSNRLILRGFLNNDFSDLLTLAVNWKSAPGPECDKWPVDENGCKGFLEYLCTHQNYYAVHLCCNEKKVIGLLAINGINENKQLDLGHVIHSDYQNNDIDREALKTIIDYLFETMDIESIITGNYPYEKQITPLKSLGFTKGENEGIYIIEKRNWKKHEEKNYKRKNKGK
jgi:RimJ/RimL family protein N-acetyltransferase